MVHTRETRASASEIKFVLDAALAPRVREWALAHLQADPHGTGTFGDEYETSTLYFDTREHDVFHRRDSFGRAKYRVRRYGESEVVFLERKLRKPGMLIKRRTVAPLDLLAELAAANGRPVNGAEWFQRRLRVRQLSPVCQISYSRTARVAPMPEGLARLTLDCSLRAVPADSMRFTPEAPVTFLEQAVILELKYRSQLPALFRRLVEEFGLTPGTASKYRLGMTALGHGGLKDRPAAPARANVSYA